MGFKSVHRGGSGIWRDTPQAVVADLIPSLCARHLVAAFLWLGWTLAALDAPVCSVKD